MSRCTFMISAARSSAPRGCGTPDRLRHGRVSSAGSWAQAPDRWIATACRRARRTVASRCRPRVPACRRGRRDRCRRCRRSRTASKSELGASPCFCAMRRAMRNCRPVRPSARIAASSCSAVGVPPEGGEAGGGACAAPASSACWADSRPALSASSRSWAADPGKGVVPKPSSVAAGPGCFMATCPAAATSDRGAWPGRIGPRHIRRLRCAGLRRPGRRRTAPSCGCGTS